MVLDVRGRCMMMMEVVRDRVLDAGRRVPATDACQRVPGRQGAALRSAAVRAAQHDGQRALRSVPQVQGRSARERRTYIEFHRRHDHVVWCHRRVVVTVHIRERAYRGTIFHSHRDIRHRGHILSTTWRSSPIRHGRRAPIAPRHYLDTIYVTK